jgi:hypothetical protein
MTLLCLLTPVTPFLPPPHQGRSNESSSLSARTEGLGHNGLPGCVPPPRPFSPCGRALPRSNRDCEDDARAPRGLLDAAPVGRVACQRATELSQPVRALLDSEEDGVAFVGVETDRPSPSPRARATVVAAVWGPFQRRRAVSRSGSWRRPRALEHPRSSAARPQRSGPANQPSAAAALPCPLRPNVAARAPGRFGRCDPHSELVLCRGKGHDGRPRVVTATTLPSPLGGRFFCRLARAVPRYPCACRDPRALRELGAVRQQNQDRDLYGRFASTAFVSVKRTRFRDATRTAACRLVRVTA